MAKLVSTIEVDVSEYTRKPMPDMTKVAVECVSITTNKISGHSILLIQDYRVTETEFPEGSGIYIRCYEVLRKAKSVPMSLSEADNLTPAFERKTDGNIMSDHLINLDRAVEYYIKYVDVEENGSTLYGLMPDQFITVND